MSLVSRWKRSDTDEANLPQRDLDLLAQRVHARLVRETDLGSLIELPRDTLEQQLGDIAAEMLNDEGVRISSSDFGRLVAAVTSEIAGFGPLDSLLQDDAVNEIMVNGPDDIYVDRNGVVERCTTVSFRDATHVRDVIDRIIFPLGRHIDESSPMVDARLPDGSRVNAVIAPLSLGGPYLTIRRFRTKPWTADDLIRLGSWTPEMAQFLAACVHARLNILISGGSGAGKTSTLNVLAGFIEPSERIVTIEEAAELRFWQTHPHVLRLEARPPNLEGQGEVTVRDLVRNALHMRPERIIVGEVRGAEALDMLQALNTGHEGSLTTIHANSAQDSFTRLETMVMWAGVPLPSAAIRDQLIGVLNIVIQQARLPGGSRKIVSISELEHRDGDIQVRELFRYHQTGIGQDGRVQGYFEATGAIPLSSERLASYSVDLPASLFAPRHLSPPNGDGRPLAPPPVPAAGQTTGVLQNVI